MKKQVQFAVITAVFLGAVSSLQGSSAPAPGVAEQKKTPVAPPVAYPQPAAEQQPASRAAREEKAIQDARRQKLAEKEAALAAKEEELKKLAESIEGQLKAFEEAKKKNEEALKTQAETKKRMQGEKVAKMTKLFKAMKAEQAGKLLDALPEQEAIVLLERLDIKTIAKLVPYINQPRLIRWIDENLNIRKVN